jgi:hypothetical protein
VVSDRSGHHTTIRMEPAMPAGLSMPNHKKAFANSHAPRPPAPDSRATANTAIISGSRSVHPGDTHFQFNTE